MDLNILQSNTVADSLKPDIKKEERELMVDEFVVCDKKMSSFKEEEEEYLGKVQRKKSLFVCDVCDIKFTSRIDLSTHQMSHKECKKNVYPCRICGESFTNSKLLTKHRKLLHKKPVEDLIKYEYTFDEENQVYTCNTCEVECLSKLEIEEHLERHVEKYSCPVCNEEFKELYKYSVHVYEHGKEIFPCAMCEYKTPRRTCILSHIKRVHLKKYTYHCKHCGKGFDDCKLHQEHEETHSENPPKYECVVCLKVFPYSRYLNLHQVRYHNVKIDGKIMEKQCEICLKIFAKLSSLNKHMESKHESSVEFANNVNNKYKEKKHLCDVCGKSYARPDKLKIHYRIHTGYKPYICSYCNKGFIKKEYLVMHERIHSGEKPYSCEYCGKCFNQGAPLRIHVRTHTGERPYICHLCESGFVSKGALNLHLKACPGKDYSNSD